MQYTRVSQLFSEIKTSPVQRLESKSAALRNILLDVKRDDLLHPIISGNKWRKLKYLLLLIEAKGYTSIASMGGSYSNFLHALAYICYLLGWQCELSIRGYSEQALTETLKDCLKWGAKINYVDRKTFKQIRTKAPKLPQRIFWIKEGGMHKSAIPGLQEILMELDKQYDYICMATATGTSIAGLIKGAEKYQPNAKLIGISVLNNAQQQREDVSRLISINSVDWSILEGYEFGGFAKQNQPLTDFVNEFSKQQNIPLEPVYSGKSFYAVMDLIDSGYFKNGSKILLIHCGGLQGAR